MPEYVFRIVAVVLYIPFVQIRKSWRKRILTHLSKKPVLERKSVRERWLLGVLGVTNLPMLAWFFGPWLDFAHVGLPEWARWGGAAIVVAGVWYFWRTHVALAQNWTPLLEVREGNTLVTTGPYRLVRHPMYSSSFVIDAGFALLSANWLVATTLLAGMAVLYAVRVNDEETLMLDAFGDEYRAYMDRTGRLAPRLSALLERPAPSGSAPR